MKNIILLVSVFLINLFWIGDLYGSAIPLPGASYDRIMTNNKILNIVVTEPDTMNSLKKLLSNQNGVLRIVNSVLGTIAILWLMILGVKFAFSQGEDDKISKYKEQFGWIAIGLAVISVAEFVAFSVFDPTVDIFEGWASDNFAEKARQIKRYFQVIVGVVAVAVCVMSGYNLVTSGSEDDAVSNEKKFLNSFFFGVGFILLAESLVWMFSFQHRWNTGSAMHSAGQVIAEVAGIVNFMLTFVAVAAVFMLVLASFYYVSSFGNDDPAGRAKNIIINSVIALLVAVSCYVFVSFFIR